MKVQSKYLDWHYTNGVTNIALMELGDKLGTSKYENYVLKNMNFIFDDANQDYFHRLYDQTLEQEGWRAVNHVNWHMIYGINVWMIMALWAPVWLCSTAVIQTGFPKSISIQTDHHLMVSNITCLPMALLPDYGPHVNTIWADGALWPFLFWSRMGEATGDAKYFDDAANQMLNYTRYLWCPERGSLSLLSHG